MPWADGTLVARAASFLEHVLLYPSTKEVQFLSGAGSDSNSGRGPGQAKLTLAAAYADLPSTGGTIFTLPGAFDVGAGFNGNTSKMVDIIGLVQPTKMIGSATTTPLAISNQCTVIRSSANPVSLITWTAGAAAPIYQGLRFRNLVFEISGSNMLYALNLANACRSEVSDCLFFCDKTTSPAPVNGAGVWFHNDGTANSDSSWNRVFNNMALNTAVAQFGNLTGSGIANSNNQNLLWGNYCLGLLHTNTSCLAAATFTGGHRCASWGNNFEAYQVGLLADRCWQCSFQGDGGEVVDYFYDLVSVHGCYLAPLGPSFKNLGSSSPKSWVTPGAAALVRGDTFTKRNVIVLLNENAADTNGNWNPTNDPTNPSLQLASMDNVIIAPRSSSNFSSPGGKSTQTPGAVSTVNIAHGLGATPVKFGVQPADADARGAPAFNVTADATNIILTFASNLTGAVAYEWQWWAEAL